MKKTRVFPPDDSLEKLAEQVKGCLLCGLSGTRKNAVPGEGSPFAKIMFVGEAPGRNEDEKGRPFAGAAGKLLDKLLQKAGIERSQVFITNVVKCRPPRNRMPHEGERSACGPYLDQQIALISPEVICVLGRTAYSSLLGGKSITADRGKFLEKDGQTYFLTYHPAAAIYRKSLSSVLESDLKKLARWVRDSRAVVSSAR